MPGGTRNLGTRYLDIQEHKSIDQRPSEYQKKYGIADTDEIPWHGNEANFSKLCERATQWTQFKEPNYNQRSMRTTSLPQVNKARAITFTN